VQNSGQLLFLAVIAVFLVWTLSRGRRQQRATQLTQSRIHPGSEVMMTSGLYGTVVGVDDDGTVRLETSPGTVSRWDRRAVARIITVAEPAEPGAPAEPADLPSADTAEPADPPAHGTDEPVETAVPAEPARPTTQGLAPPDRD
jgi:preprotein translocase subunit YajC